MGCSSSHPGDVFCVLRGGSGRSRGGRSAQQRAAGSSAPTEASQVMPSNGPMWSSAPTDRRGSFSKHPGQRRRAKRLRRGREGWVGIAAEFTPKVASNLGQSLSQPAADSSLCTREPWGRGMRIAASARWASSQLQWFPVIPRSGATWESVLFTMDEGRHAGVVVPYGGCGGPHQPPGGAGA